MPKELSKLFLVVTKQLTEQDFDHWRPQKRKNCDFFVFDKVNCPYRIELFDTFQLYQWFNSATALFLHVYVQHSNE